MSDIKRNIAISLPLTGEEEWQAVREPLMSGWLTQGPKVAQFEKMFAERHKVDHALAVTSCTTGLHLALAGLDIQPGDEVIVPAFTWVATANVVLYCGATPVFVDIDINTYNLDIAQVASKVTAKTKAVIAVHLFGLCADIDSLRAVLPAHVKIVEDAACAAGADWKGRPAGSLGDIGVFSFHPRKSVTTGEGGMVTTNDENLAERMNQMRNHGASLSEEQRHKGPRPYFLPDFNLLGYNYRMTDLQGAVGIVQLEKLDKFIDERAQWAAYYHDNLADVSWLRLPKSTNECRHGWQAFVTYVDPKTSPIPRNDIMQVLQDKGIATRPGTHAVHMLGYYQERFGSQDADFPVAQDANDNTMAIPLHNRMVKEDYDYVIQALKDIA
jgi:dTDP-4-amino-4,6-dideoxygalactose transaminase